MNDTNNQQSIAAPKHQSRNERRWMERRVEEAKQIHDKLANEFLDYFITHTNPDSVDVVDKAKDITAKWKTYCRAKGLTIQSLSAMDIFINSVIANYIKDRGEVSIEVQAKQSIVYGDENANGAPIGDEQNKILYGAGGM